MNTKTETYKRLIEALPVFENEKRLLWLGFYFTIYFEDGHTNSKRLAVLDIFNEYCELCGAELKWTTNPQTKVFEKISSANNPNAWLLQSAFKKHVWQLIMHGGNSFDECSPFLFSGFGTPLSPPHNCLSFLSISFPITWFADKRPGYAQSLFKRWSSLINPLHGSAGISILTSPFRNFKFRVCDHVCRLAKRFPGLEIDYPLDHSLCLYKGIKGVNWLTIIQNSWIEKIGGSKKLRKQLIYDAVIHEYKGGVIIQAGEFPQIGDVNRNIDVKFYRNVSKVLKPIRVEYPTSILGFNAEETQQWIQRFD